MEKITPYVTTYLLGSPPIFWNSSSVPIQKQLVGTCLLVRYTYPNGRVEVKTYHHYDKNFGINHKPDKCIAEWAIVSILPVYIY